MLNRRDIFGVTAAVAMAAVPIAVQATAHPDAELIALGADFEQAKSGLDSAAREADRIAKNGGQAAADAANVRWEEAYAYFNAVEDRIVAMPCRSLEGLKVKAKVAKFRLDPAGSPDSEWKDVCALSVVDFILDGGLG